MVLVLLLSPRFSALVRFGVAAKSRTVAILRDDPSTITDLAQRSGCGKDPSFLGHAARLAGILHVIVIGICIRIDCVCTGQRWTNVADGGFSTGASRCRTAG